MNLVIKQTRVVEVPVQSISVAATCHQAMLIDAAGQCVGSIATMPSFMPTLLEIDLATGQIKNWTVPTGEQLQAIADACADGQKSKIERKAHEEQLKNDVKKRHEYVLAQLRISEPLVVSPALTTTPAPPQTVESAAIVTTNAVDCAPTDQQPNSTEIEGIKADDEPTDAPELVEVDSGILMFGGVVPEVVPVILDSNVLTIDAPLTLDMLLDAAPAPVTAESVQREQFAEFLAERGIEPSAPKPTNQISVEYDHLAEKWHAEANDHQATSTIGKFEAIKNVLKKANLHGVYEINRIEDGLYGYDGSRTLNADTVYTQGTDGAWSARKPNNRHVSAVIGIDGALTGLLKEMEGIQPEDAVIIETTDDEMRSRNKRRYAVTSRHEYVNTPDSMFNALQMVNLGFNLDLCDGLACIAAGLVKLTPGKSEKDIDGQTMAVLQLTEKGDELWSTLGRSDLNQDAADDVLRAYLLKDPHFDQLSRAVESCKTSIGIRCLEMHIKSIHDKQMQAALWDTINRRKPYLLDTTAA
ncbi:MAG: hypothetical protein ACEQSD_00735 [Flavobacteriales bacterium]